MTQKKRMLAGLPYRVDAQLLQELRACRCKIFEFNSLPADDEGGRENIFRSLFGRAGKNVYIQPPFRCDYGFNITLGDNIFINYNCTILDVAPVTIGNNVLIAPNVSIYTASHPVHPDCRRSGYESGASVYIGDDVWIGGNAVINPGIIIGAGSIIASGSVVIKEVPGFVIAGGNPARIIREITEEDKRFYFKNREFDVEDYLSTRPDLTTGAQ